MYCTGCGEPLSYEAKFCGKCGTEATSAPRAISGKNGLDPRRFVEGTPVVNANQSSGGGGNVSHPERDPGQVNASIARTYEYIKPGSFEKSTQTLVLNANGKCSYKEVGETSMEKFETTGDGTWDVSGGVVRVLIHSLAKTSTFKSKPLVPGIKDGTSYEYNITIPITESELINATAHGTNKWRIVQ